MYTNLNQTSSIGKQRFNTVNTVKDHKDQTKDLLEEGTRFNESLQLKGNVFTQQKDAKHLLKKPLRQTEETNDVATLKVQSGDSQPKDRKEQIDSTHAGSVSQNADANAIDQIDDEDYQTMREQNKYLKNIVIEMSQFIQIIEARESRKFQQYEADVKIGIQVEDYSCYAQIEEENHSLKSENIELRRIIEDVEAEKNYETEKFEMLKKKYEKLQHENENAIKEKCALQEQADSSSAKFGLMYKAFKSENRRMKKLKERCKDVAKSLEKEQIARKKCAKKCSKLNKKLTINRTRKALLSKMRHSLKGLAEDDKLIKEERDALEAACKEEVAENVSFLDEIEQCGQQTGELAQTKQIENQLEPTLKDLDKIKENKAKSHRRVREILKQNEETKAALKLEEEKNIGFAEKLAFYEKELETVKQNFEKEVYDKVKEIKDINERLNEVQEKLEAEVKMKLVKEEIIIKLTSKYENLKRYSEERAEMSEENERKLKDCCNELIEVKKELDDERLKLQGKLLADASVNTKNIKEHYNGMIRKADSATQIGKTELDIEVMELENEEGISVIENKDTKTLNGSIRRRRRKSLWRRLLCGTN